MSVCNNCSLNCDRFFWYLLMQNFVSHENFFFCSDYALIAFFGLDIWPVGLYWFWHLFDLIRMFCWNIRLVCRFSC